jgi:hypothetical protein
MRIVAHHLYSSLCLLEAPGVQQQAIACYLAYRSYSDKVGVMGSRNEEHCDDSWVMQSQTHNKRREVTPVILARDVARGVSSAAPSIDLSV